MSSFQSFVTSLSTEKFPLCHWTVAWKAVGRRHKSCFGNRRAQKSKNEDAEKGDARRFDIAGLKKKGNSSECMISVLKNVVLFADLIGVKFETTLGCANHLFRKFPVTLFVVCNFFFLICRNTMLIMNCLQNKGLIHWHILHYLKRSCFLLW